MTQKINWSVVIWVLVLGLTIWYLVWGDNPSDKQPIDISSPEQVEQNLISEIAIKNNAIVDWEDKLQFTYEAQERLTNDQPALFFGFIDDIFKKDGRYYLRLNSSWDSKTAYTLEAQCPLDKLPSVLNTDRNDYSWLFDRYVVVAHVEEVSTPVYALNGTTFEQASVEIEVEPARRYIVKGSCVEVARLPEKNRSE